MRNIFEADVYAMGHVHELAFTTTQKLYVDRKLHIAEKIQYYILTGGFLRGYCPNSTSYIEKKMLRPTRLGSAKISITPFHNNSFRIEPGEVF
jgi:hypothetical protein